MPIALFSWGYYGWGNHTRQFVEAVDAVEKRRKFKPSVFVDIRIRRAVRAAGFTGPAFERLLGQKRHRWMKALGNRFIQTRKGERIQIAEPRAANDLLDLALELRRSKQRLLFFCSCEWPKWDGEIECHRCTVARLVLDAAKRRKISAEVVEWPGGTPEHIHLDLSKSDFNAALRGRLTVPLGKRVDLARYAGLPWGSIATLRCRGERVHRLVGPAMRQSDAWALPVLRYFDDPSTSFDQYEREAAMIRRKRGLEPIRT